jgi:hypothetical protein
MLLGKTTILEIRSCVFYVVCASNDRNWVLCDHLLGYATVLTIELFSVLSVLQLHTKIPRISNERPGIFIRDKLIFSSERILHKVY